MPTPAAHQPPDVSMRLSLLSLVLLLTAAGCRIEPRAADAPAAEPAVLPGAAVAEPARQPDQRPAEAVPPGERPEVVLYVTEWCPYCKQAREYMDAEGVPHRVVDIEASDENRREYQARGGRGNIPLVAVGTETIEGWSADVARQMLDAAGYD